MQLMRGILCVAAALSVQIATAQAQTYPSRVVRIVTAEPGGAFDFASRLIAQGLSGSLGQQVIVDNHGGGIALADYAAHMQPDGYSIFLTGSNLWVVPLMQTAPYDALRDFMPITTVNVLPTILVVHPSLPVKSVKELIALAKARPGELNYASGNTGTPSHLAAELFKYMAKLNVVRIPYKAAGAAVSSVLGGQEQFMFASASSVVPLIKSGRLRALAVTSAQPSVLFPELPTMSTTLPGYNSFLLLGLFAPAKTPVAIIQRLNQEVAKVLARPDIKEKFANAGVETTTATPEQFTAIIKADRAVMEKMIKDTGIHID